MSLRTKLESDKMKLVPLTGELSDSTINYRLTLKSELTFLRRY